MLHMHLLPRVGIRRLGLFCTDVQTQIPRHQASLATTTISARFGIDDAVATLSRLHEFRVLFLEDGEVPLGFPVPDGVGGEDEVHFFQGALVGFGVEGPDDDDGGGVDGAEEVEGLFVEFLEDGGEEEDLGDVLVCE